MADKELILVTDPLDPAYGMYYATVPDPVGVQFQDSHVCHLCGLSFRENESVKFRGRWYGRPCSCYLDIEHILRGESERRKSHRESPDRD